MSIEARKVAEQEYGLALQAERYLQLYQRTIIESQR